MRVQSLNWFSSFKSSAWRCPQSVIVGVSIQGLRYQRIECAIGKSSGDLWRDNQIAKLTFAATQESHPDCRCRSSLFVATKATLPLQSAFPFRTNQVSALSRVVECQ
jgi:hypothetical protein